jgi:hypothetical protein
MWKFWAYHPDWNKTAFRSSFADSSSLADSGASDKLSSLDRTSAHLRLRP